MVGIEWVSLSVKKLGEETVRTINNKTREYLYGNREDMEGILGELPGFRNSCLYGISPETYEKLKKVTRIAGNGPC